MQSWKSEGMEGSMKPGSRFRACQQVKRSFLWNSGFGLLVRSCKSGTAWTAGTGMRSEIVMGMGTSWEGEKLEVSDRSWLGFRGQVAENKDLRKKSCCVPTVHNHSFWSCNFGGRVGEMIGGCLAHAPGICWKAAGGGWGLGRAGRGRQRKWWYTTREEEESHNWLPAEDNFQLATVELPSVRQAHDALLVARQILQVHLLNQRKGGMIESVKTFAAPSVM